VNINLRPEDEDLIQRQLESGVFRSPEEVVHRALESLRAEEAWLQENRAAIHEKIEQGFRQFERGEGLTKEESLSELEAKKAAWPLQPL
jgi:antitoxin ParD1/3/4